MGRGFQGSLVLRVHRKEPGSPIQRPPQPRKRPSVHGPPLAKRQGIDDPDRRARFGAVYAAKDEHAIAAELYDRALAVSRRADGLFNALPDPVPEEVKQERLQRFMELQAEISAAKLEAKVGSVQQVLIDASPMADFGINQPQHV